MTIVSVTEYFNEVKGCGVLLILVTFPNTIKLTERDGMFKQSLVIFT